MICPVLGLIVGFKIGVIQLCLDAMGAEIVVQAYRSFVLAVEASCA
jgi:hypothetical protein